jgi:hypothetical protein
MLYALGMAKYNFKEGTANELEGHGAEDTADATEEDASGSNNPGAAPGVKSEPDDAGMSTAAKEAIASKWGDAIANSRGVLKTGLLSDPHPQDGASSQRPASSSSNAAKKRKSTGGGESSGHGMRWV